LLALELKRPQSWLEAFGSDFFFAVDFFCAFFSGAFLSWATAGAAARTQARTRARILMAA
jgi:hypothetical protein